MGFFVTRFDSRFVLYLSVRRSKFSSCPVSCGEHKDTSKSSKLSIIFAGTEPFGSARLNVQAAPEESLLAKQGKDSEPLNKNRKDTAFDCSKVLTCSNIVLYRYDWLYGFFSIVWCWLRRLGRSLHMPCEAYAQECCSPSQLFVHLRNQQPPGPSIGPTSNWSI